MDDPLIPHLGDAKIGASSKLDKGWMACHLLKGCTTPFASGGHERVARRDFAISGREFQGKHLSASDYTG